MSNIFYQGAEIAMSSGNAGALYAKIERVQDIKFDFAPPRTNIGVLGRFAPLAQRPVINFTPVNLAVSYTKGNKEVETNLGLLNNGGVLTQIGTGNSIIGYGLRNFQIYLAPANSSNYAGEYDVMSGVLKSFSLAGDVGSPVKGAFSIEGLDLQQVANTSARTTPTYAGNLVKNENMSITGINFTGLGFSSLMLQSFNLQVSINHAATLRIGTKYPERQVTDGVASLQVQGFLEGVTNSVSSLSTYDCGNYLTGQYVISLQPSCSTEPATTITMANPYLESMSLGAQVGNFVSVDMSFMVPLSILPSEIAGNASNLTII